VLAFGVFDEGEPRAGNPRTNREFVLAEVGVLEEVQVRFNYSTELTVPD